MIKRITNEDGTNHTISPRKRQTCSLDCNDNVLEPPVKKSKMCSGTEEK